MTVVLPSASTTSLELDVSDAPRTDTDEQAVQSFTPFAGQPIPEDSALDDSVDLTPADLPSFLSAPSTRVRRRSELAFARPPKAAADDDKGALELPTLTASSAVAPYLSSKGPVVVQAVETPMTSLGTTPAPSVQYSETAPLDGGLRKKQKLYGSLFQVATYAMLAPAGPFPMNVLAYSLTGFGMALQNAGGNGFVGSLKNDTSTKFGLLHGAYGVGAFLAPLAATHFAQTRHWSYHFFISLGLAVSNTASLALIFRFRSQDEIMAEAGREPGDVGTAGDSKMRQILSLKVVHYLALFAIIYIGVEVTLGGWIVTFIIRERQGGPNAGYISSGYFGGLTLGRISLIWLNRKIGERHALFIYCLICIGSVFSHPRPSLVHLTLAHLTLAHFTPRADLKSPSGAVPSLIENALAVSVIGLLMGPMYPILVNYAKGIIPGWLLTGSLGWITGIGQSGSAVLPFVAGLLASKFGIASMQPL
ncbi:hypothetical protein EWM64_g6699 [Hericium alpestre]|uniref:Major facilitator superfamily (MFS) profile domain-containing protein n=1 Tax=Hericium alpestre TaxID=135208 RepID=A0A4Y9ZU02_9AGAM|nr:hypothetical protein EWM64_g6699 [Hericium alpestre]